MVLLSIVLINMFYPLLGKVGYDNKRCLQVFFVIVSHLLLVNKEIVERYISVLFSIPPFTFWIFISFLLSAGLALCLADFELYAFGDLLHYALLFNIVPLMAAAVTFTDRIQKILLRGVFFGFVLALISFLFMCFFSVFLGGKPINPWDTYPNVANIRFFNQIHIQVIFLLPVLSLLVPSRYSILMLFVGGLSTYMLLVAYGRGVLLSLLAVYLVASFLSIYFQHEMLKKILLIFFKMLVAGLVIFFLMEVLYILMGTSTVDSPSLFRVSHTRFNMWEDVLRGILDSPLGIGAYHYSSYNQGTDFSSYSHPHNFLLQITLEWGVLAGIGLLALVIGLCVLTVKKIKGIDNPIILGLFLSIWAAWCYSFFSGVFVMPASQTVFVVLLGILLSYPEVCSKSQVQVVVSNKKHIVVIGVMVGLLTAYAYYVVESYNLYQKGIETEINRAISLSNGGEVEYEFMTNGPRMWLRGGIVVPVGR